MRQPVVALVMLGAAAALPAATWSQPSDRSAGEALRTELTLEARRVALSYQSALEAAAPAHRPLLSDATADTRIRIGELSGSNLLRIGSLDRDEDSSDEPPYDVWLARRGGEWLLDVGTARRGGVDGEPIRSIPLTHAPLSEPVMLFSAALVPTGERTGQLHLRWAHHRWAADFHFAEPPPQKAADRDQELRRNNEAGRRTYDSDTESIGRGMALRERHETVLVRPDETRISVMFWKAIGADHPDRVAVDAVPDGGVVRLTEAAVLRLRTEVGLQFGRTAIRTGNLASNFPGTYGLWLKRAGAGWRLVFNNEPDSWGTQHDPAFDAAEIAVVHAIEGPSGRPLGVSLRPTGVDTGRLVVHWGPHEWSADFTVLP